MTLRSSSFDIARPAAPRRKASFLARVMALAGLRRQRLALGRLDDHMLRDIGVSRAEARREAERPVWDAPVHWCD